MAIDRELLKRILEHYKHRVDEFLEDEKIKPLASGNLAVPITNLRKDVDAAIEALPPVQTSVDAEIKDWIRSHGEILKPAVAQYEKDAKLLLEEARDKLSDPNLRELEIELATITDEIATLLNL